MPPCLNVEERRLKVATFAVCGLQEGAVLRVFRYGCLVCLSTVACVLYCTDSDADKVSLCLCVLCAEHEELRQRAEQERQQSVDRMEFPHRRRTMLVAGVMVVTVMMSYALLTGLWKVKVVDNIVDEVVKVVKGEKDREMAAGVDKTGR